MKNAILPESGSRIIIKSVLAPSSSVALLTCLTLLDLDIINNDKASAVSIRSGCV